MKRMAIAVALCSVAACGGSGGGGGAPTQPNPPAPQQNRAPIINSMGMSPSFGISGLSSLTYSASASDPDGDPVTYSWDLAGSTRTGSSGTIIFSGGGIGDARLTVADGRGGSATDTRSFTIGTMSGNWLITTGPLANASFSLTQSANGIVTGTFSLPGIGGGNTDPAQPGRIDANGTLTMRVKVGPFTDFNMNGTMTETGRVVNGSLQGSGFTGQPFTMAKQ